MEDHWRASLVEEQLFFGLLVVYFVVALGTLIGLLVRPAPYGRHSRAAGFGPVLSARSGWVLMELPALLVVPLCFCLQSPRSPVGWLFLLLWLLHYGHRTLIFPMRLPSNSRPMPLPIAASGFLFNVWNGYLVGRGLTTFGHDYPSGWLRDPRLWLGVAGFVAGWIANRHSDRILLRLRREDAGYRIPEGGLFRWVSCPNYLGEIIQWAGFALCTWSLPALGFALFTIANLLPRALSHHRWYQQTFPDYPTHRRALLPGLI